MAAKTFGKRGVQSAPIRVAVSRSAPVAAIEPVGAVDHARAFDNFDALLAAMPFLTLAIILGLTGIFLLETHFAFDVGKGASISPESLVAFGATSYQLVVTSTEPWRIFLSPLLHASGSHLAGNCFAFLLVGIRLEPLIGRGWFAAIFVVSGLTATVVSVFCNTPTIFAVGASGAIMGVVVALLVMSFHDRADELEKGAMRRRSLFFAVPALLPLYFGIQDGTDYYGHLGGALAGGLIGLGLVLFWSGSFRPPFAREMGFMGAGGLLLAIVCVFFVTKDYEAEALSAQAIIPSASLTGTIKDVAARAPDLMARYPHDPRARLYLALYDADHNLLSDAEANLRSTMAQDWPQRPNGADAVHEIARAFLALVVNQEGRRAEAMALAQNFCAGRGSAKERLMLAAVKLCPTTASNQGPPRPASPPSIGRPVGRQRS